jgi:hypothetical protein
VRTTTQQQEEGGSDLRVVDGPLALLEEEIAEDGIDRRVGIIPGLGRGVVLEGGFGGVGLSQSEEEVG